MSTKVEAEDVKQYVEDQLEEQTWVRKILTENDNVREWHVAVYVQRLEYSTSGHKIPTLINGVPVVILMIG